MPKAAIIQTGFNTGEVSPLLYGAVDNPRYKKGLATCLNYIPTLQGPVIRRPATKYCANVKDSSNPPVMIPFRYSSAINYVLEFGNGYIRFYTNNGQVLTSGTPYQVSGTLNFINYNSVFYTFYAVRQNGNPLANESILSKNTVSTGIPLELLSPYQVADVSLIRWCQDNDTLYLFHPNYPTYKLQYFGNSSWKLSAVYFQDGPYLAANSYSTVGDQVGIQLVPLQNLQVPVTDIQVSSSVAISGAASSSGQIEITTSAAHGFTSGQNVFITGVGGTTEANNYSSYSGRTVASTTAFWTIQVVDSTHFILLGSTFTHAYTSGGLVFVALWATSASIAAISGFPPDIGRVLAMQITTGGNSYRYWGTIEQIYDAATVQIVVGGTGPTKPNAFPNTASDEWYLGAYFGLGTGGQPGCGAFHQDRLVVSGSKSYPQRVDGSETGIYETFSPSAATGSGALQVVDSNAWSFTLNSGDSNPLCWLASTAFGLCAASYTAEWAMTPSSNSEALTPTNFNAAQTSFYGSAQVQPVKIGNAVLYMQRAQRKLREMTYFFYAGTFRSSDLTEISEHITIPTITQLEVQKETQPLIWGIRSDGALTSLIYNRDDVSLSVGWTRHILGGRSDSAGTPPTVKSMAIIPDPTQTFDQWWGIVKRYINGATVYTIEYMTKIFDDSILQEDAFQGDCGGTYDNPLTITALTNASPPVVTSPAHGLSNGQTVRIVGVDGLNKSITDINGNVTISNAVNEQTFTVAGVATNTFHLEDANGNALDFTSFSAYVSGGQARKLVTTITGLTWLENETVNVLTDGGNHPPVTVSNSGSITLQYPAAKVQIGYAFPSQGQLLRPEAGSAEGTSIGQTRRACRAAVQVHRSAELSMGMAFNDLIPFGFAQADENQADQAAPLWSGILRDGLNSAYDFESQVCFQQSSMLPGTIQSISVFLEENDV